MFSSHHVLNCSHDIPPNITTHFQELSTGEFVVVGIYSFLLLLTWLIYFYDNVYKHRYSNTNGPLYRMKYIQAVYVVYSTMAYLALISPRSSIVCELVFAIYISFALKEFMCFMLELMQQNQPNECETVSLAATPLACCCWLCCPRVKVSKTFILGIKFGVYQAVVLRPLLAFIETILWSNGFLKFGVETKAGQVIELVNGISILFAMYASVLMFYASKNSASQFFINAKFICIQLVMLVACGQQNLLGLLAKVGAIPCIRNFSASVRAEDLHHLMVIPEMFVLLVISTFVHRKQNQVGNNEQEPLLNDKADFSPQFV